MAWAQKIIFYHGHNNFIFWKQNGQTKLTTVNFVRLSCLKEQTFKVKHQF